jgi:hypothetical protein
MASAKLAAIGLWSLTALGCINTLTREATLDHEPRSDPRLVRFGDDPYVNGGITVELDEPSYVAAFNVFHSGLVRAYYPYKRWQETHYTEGSHRLVGGDRSLGTPLAIVVSKTPLKLSALDDHLAEEGEIGRVNTNPGNGYEAVYEFGRSTLEETLNGLARAIIPEFEEPGWTVYYYCGTC